MVLYLAHLLELSTECRYQIVVFRILWQDRSLANRFDLCFLPREHVLGISKVQNIHWKTSVLNVI